MLFNHRVNNPVDEMNDVELRLRCTEIAASLTNNPEAAIELADKIYKFVSGG